MWSQFKRQFGKLLAAEDTPHGIALGAAIGVFVGFTPLFGLKTLLALLFSFLFRGNRIAAVVGVSLHDLTLPFWPALYLLEFDVGYWLLHWPHQWSVLPPPAQLSLQGWPVWRAFTTIAAPALLGAVLFGVPTSLMAYCLIGKVVARRQRRKSERTAKPGG